MGRVRIYQRHLEPKTFDRDLTEVLRQLSSHLRAQLVKNVINCWQLLVSFSSSETVSNLVTTFGTVLLAVQDEM